jgi:hypothetical protein
MQRLAAENKDTPDHQMGLAWVMARNAIRLFSIIPRVLCLRSRFGERYMQAYHVAGSWGIVAFAAVGASLSGVETPFGDPPSRAAPVVGVLFLVLYSLMLGLRYFGVLRRRLRGEFTVHSYSEGAPWPLWQKLRIPVPVVGLVIEPLIILLAGYLLGHVLELPMLQFLAWVVGLAHFIEQQIIAAQERARLLDAADNLIEQRLAQERLGLIRAGARPAPTQPQVPAPDQQALQHLMQQTRAAAAAEAQPAGGE